MFKLPSIHNILSKVKETFFRFPFALSITVAITAVGIYLTYLDHSDILLVKTFGKLEFALVIGFILMVAIQLYNESIARSDSRKLILKVIGLLHCIGYYFSISDIAINVHIYRFIILIIGMNVLISFSAFIKTKNINSFWQFNKSLFLRFLTSMLYSGVLYLGLSLALLAIDQLFNANIDEEVYLRLWIVIIGIINPWILLSGVPKILDYDEEITTYPKGLKIFTQFILLPLVSVYITILYVYLFKIIFTWNIPEGWVSYLVLCCSSAGIFSLLLIYPLRNDEEHKWISIFSKWFYRALFPLIVLLIVAIYQRVNQYGITENRYFVIILTIWLTCVSIYFLLSKVKNIKYIPISLFIIGTLSIFGPWSSFSLSKRSQMKILTTRLTDLELLVNNKIVVSDNKISHEDHSQISSIIKYLVNNHGHNVFQTWFEQDIDSLFKLDSLRNSYQKTDKILELMSMDLLDDTSSNNSFYYSTKNRNSFPVSGYDYYISLSKYYLGRDSLFDNNKIVYNYPNDTFKIGYSAIDGNEIIIIKGEIRESILLSAFVENIQNNLSSIESVYEVPEKLMTIGKETEKIKFTIYFNEMEGYFSPDKGKIHINRIEADILLKFAIDKSK